MEGERRRIWNGLLFAVFLTLLAFVSVGCAANAYTVCSTGCNYTSIQAAVTAANPGDMIIVRDGMYTENVNVNQRLTIRSENDSANCIVQAADPNDYVFEITADWVNLTGLTVQNTTRVFKAGIYLGSGADHCMISNNTASKNDYGILLYFSSNNTLMGNNASNNDRCGIYLESSNNSNLTGNTVNSNYHSGISLSSSSTNNTLTGNTASDNYYGIYLSYSSANNTLIGNAASNNNFGIILSSSSNNSVTGNAASNNAYGIHLESSSTNNTLTGNTVNSNTYYGIYLESSITNNLMGNTVSNNSYGIYLIASNNSNLTGNAASNNSGLGICLSSSSNNTLTSNSVSNNNCGYYLSSSNNNIVTGNTVLNNNNYGIHLDSSCNNSLTGNTVNSNIIFGIILESSSKNNTLTINTVSNNSYGISLSSSSNDNTLTGNTANLNKNYGVVIESSSNNLIYNNHFDNAVNAYDDDNNIWNISKTPGTNIIGGSWLGGNYWSDYAGKDTDGDELGNTMLPYNSTGEIQNGGDWLPLVRFQVLSLTGTLTYACNGTGIAEGTVNLTQNGSVLASTASDANGHYSFTNLSAGVYAVNVSKRRCFDNSSILTINAGETTVVNLTLWLKGDLNNNCIQADAGDLAKLKDASVGKIAADWRFDLNSNTNNADAGDLAKLKDASVGKIELL